MSAGAPQAQWHARLAPFFLWIVLFVASLSPIWSNDYFWHLAAGRWIVEHGSLPEVDPLAVASTPSPWLNGEWLFQVAVYGLERLGGHTGIALMRAFLIASVFTFLFVRSRREITASIAFCAVFFTWYGALPWLRERPATIGTILLLILLVTLQRGLSPRGIVGAVVLVVVWVNVHPSALLAPVIVFLWGAAEMWERREWARSDIARLIGFPAIIAGALLLNPHGFEGVINPLRVARIAQLPAFANEEWARTSLREFPLFTVWLIVWFAVLATTQRRRHWLPSAVTAVFLAILALRFARNQPLFYVATPILLMPHLRPAPGRILRVVMVAVAITAVAILANSDFSVGIDRRKFPVEATERVREVGIDGNILSPYGLGGYLVWSFMPERRVLTDGRNELFVEYQHRLMDSRRSSEKWERFLTDYDVSLAFVPASSPAIFVRDRERGTRRPMREWEIYFPAGRWALVAVDDAAAVFANRQKVDASTIGRAELPREILEGEQWSR